MTVTLQRLEELWQPLCQEFHGQIGVALSMQLVCQRQCRCLTKEDASDAALPHVGYGPVTKESV